MVAHRDAGVAGALGCDVLVTHGVEMFWWRIGMRDLLGRLVEKKVPGGSGAWTWLYMRVILIQEDLEVKEYFRRETLWGLRPLDGTDLKIGHYSSLLPHRANRGEISSVTAIRDLRNRNSAPKG